MNTIASNKFDSQTPRIYLQKKKKIKTLYFVAHFCSTRKPDLLIVTIL